MSLNSNKISQDRITGFCLENGYDRYTLNPSAFSIHNDLSLLLGSSQSRQENTFEFKPQEKKRFTKEMLFKIRNEQSEQIKSRIPLIFKDQVGKNGVWDPEQHFFGEKTASFSMNNKQETYNSYAISNAGQELLNLIKGSSKKESLIDVPYKKKTNALDRFVNEHPDLVNESAMKHKIPKAPTVQEIESQFVPSLFMYVKELESMQFNQNKISQNQMDVDDGADSGLMDEENNVNINQILKEREHFNNLIQKLRLP